MKTAPNKIADVRCCGGSQQRYSHRSSSLDCDMNFSLYLPPQAEQGAVPLLVWLSGLTCTDENFVTKAGAQRYAAEHGIAILTPDTSPRGEGVPDDPDGAWDFGLGAGFYVNATEAPWSAHYRMYSYVTEELPALLRQHFGAVDVDNCAISGHSMGGHGALTIALRASPGQYRSVSAFSPIVSPSTVPWGRKAFSRYLGDDENTWREHDSCALLRQRAARLLNEDGAQSSNKAGAQSSHADGTQSPHEAGARLPMLVDQGTADEFLEEHLQTPLLERVCKEVNYPAEIRYQEGYDHSYYFIASFIGDHIAFHAKALGDSA